MTDRPEPRSAVTAALTVAAVVGVMICCAVPLLLAAGLLASAGVLLDNLLIVALGLGVLAWALTRAVRARRARDRSADPIDRTRT